MVGRVPVALKITFFLYQLNKNDNNKRKTLWLVKKKNWHVENYSCWQNVSVCTRCAILLRLG